MEVETVDAAPEIVSDAADAEIIGSDSDPQTDLEILSTEDAPEVVVPDAPPPLEAEKPNESTAEEPKEEPETPEDPKPAEGEKKPEEAKPVEPELPASVKRMNQLLSQNPSLKAELDKPGNAILRNTIMANARRSQELTTYKEKFATPELAESARADAEALGDIEGMYFSAKPEGFDNLLQHMYKQQLNSDGTPRLDDKGQPVSTLESFFTHQRTHYFWPQLSDFAKSADGKARLEAAGIATEDFDEALQIVRKLLNEDGSEGSIPRAAAVRSDDAYKDYPPEVRAKLAKIDTLERQQGQSAEQQGREWNTGIGTAITSDVKTLLAERVERLAPALSDPIKKRIIDDSYSEIEKIAASDKVYQMNWNRAFRNAARTDEAKATLVGQAKAYAASKAGGIVQKFVQEFSSEAIKVNQQTHTKATEQAKRTEVQSTGGVTPPRQGDVLTMIAEGEKLSRQYRKRGLTEGEILDIEDHLPLLQKLGRR